MSLTVLTPTGDRPEALERCKWYLKKQTVQPDQWLVVDDGLTLYRPEHPALTYITMPPEPNKHTLARNVAAAIPHIKGDNIVIMEDDDWYGPDYLAHMVNGLDDYDLYGEGNAWYYNIQFSCYLNNANNTHASFCQTGFRRSMLKLLSAVTVRQTWDIDLRFWRAAGSTKKVYMQDKQPWVVGIKGVPGRRGTTIGWTATSNSYIQDTKHKKLRSLIDNDSAEYYIKLAEATYG